MCFLIFYVGRNPLPFVHILPSPLINLSSNTFNVTMKCIPHDTRLQYSYTWEKQNEKLPSRAHGINSSLLTIINLRTEDTGMYRCIISNLTEKVASNFSMLTVKGDYMIALMYSYVCRPAIYKASTCRIKS